MCSKQTLDEIQERVYRAAKVVLGDKLEKILLFGSYARGDFDDESDIDIFVLADIRPEEACGVSLEIIDGLGDIGLENDVIISPHVVCSKNFYAYHNILPFYMNVMKEGKELAYA